MGYTTDNCTYLLHRIYRAMKDEETTLSFQRGVHPEQGRIYRHENGEDIQVNPRGDVLSTIIHEYIHWLLPKATEDDVIALEATMAENLTNQQWANLFVKAAQIIRPSKENTKGTG